MAKSNVNGLVPAIANAVAEIAALPKPATISETARCAIWAHAANDKFTPRDVAGKPAEYTVFRAFVASAATWGRNRAAIQAATWGPTPATAIARCELVYNAMLDGTGDDAVARRAWAIAGFTVSIYRLVFGGIVAADADGAWCVFNFEAAHAPRN